jgi:phosphoglycerate dehydrogenase-like enzyme
MKLLLTGAFEYSEEQLEQLKAIGYEILFVQEERVPLSLEISDVDGVVCNNLFLYNDITKFEHLKFIQLTSTGIDRVPLDFIKAHGIQLFNAKGVYSTPIAEWVILKILEICKRSRQFYEAQENHKWEKQKDLMEIYGRVVTIIGFGDIGLEIAKRLRSFGVYLIGVGKREMEHELLDEYHVITDINEVLAISDIVILTLPLTEETYHFMDYDKIARMKKNSILINISRGNIIDEIALLEALQGEQLLRVALDVFEEEPLPPDSPLWDLSNVIITPHNSYASDKMKLRLFDLIFNRLWSIKSSLL